MRPRFRRLATPVVLGVTVATVAALAVSAHGFAVQHVNLNDGSIWVTNNAAGAVGRLAKPIGQLALASASTSLDVGQNGPLVATYDASGGRLYAVNAYATSFSGAGTTVSPGTGGGTVALGDWRDYDGDPLYIDSGSVRASAGSATATSDGALSLTAPRTTAGETVTLTYGVSDGRVAKPQITSAGTTASHTFTGLANGTTYTFTVRAVNGTAPGRGR